MTNVVHFPTKEVKIDKIKDYLDNAMETLEETINSWTNCIKVCTLWKRQVTN